MKIERLKGQGNHPNKYGFIVRIGERAAYPTYNHWYQFPAAVLWVVRGFLKK